MSAIIINGYLPQEVTNSKHRSARVAVRYVRDFVKKANGKAERVEVLKGEIYLNLKDGTGLKELKDDLEAINGVTVEQPSEAALIYRKEKARAETKQNEKQQ